MGTVSTKELAQNNLPPLVIFCRPFYSDGYLGNVSASVTVIAKETWCLFSTVSKAQECRGYQMAVATVFGPFTHLAK